MKTLFAILLLFVSRGIIAQPGQIVFDHYGPEQGFYSREAKDIVVADNGLVWITTSDGLVRFDSKRFKFYQHSAENPHSLTYDFCGALEKDKRGWIWVASYRELDVFDPETEVFSHLKIYDKDNNPESIRPMSFYYNKNKDIMWIGTKQGLYYSMNGSLKLEKAPLLDKKGNKINDIFSLCSDGVNIWITSGSVIYKVNDVDFSTEEYVLPDKVNGIKNVPGSGLISSYIDNTKTLWMGTWTTGLVSFNTITHQFQQYVYNDYTRQQNGIIEIKQSGLPGQENILWISTIGFGFSAFNTVTKSFISYGTDFHADIRGIKGNTYGIYTVPDKGMWIGSQAGLHYYDFTKQLFDRLYIKSIQGGEKNLPVADMAFEKGADAKDEKIWFNIPYKGSYIYDLRTDIIKPAVYPGDAANENDQFFPLFIDSRNILWASSGRQGFTAIDLKSNKIKLTGQKTFSDDWKWISRFIENGEKIWLGTFNGLYLVNRQDFSIIEMIKVNEELKKNKLSLMFMAAVMDDNNKVWFVTDFSTEPNSCIGYFDPKEDTVKLIYQEPATYKKGSPLHEFTDIAFSNGKIFVSDRMNGIWYFNASDKKPVMKLLNQAQGIMNTRVGQLLTDQKGNIWCGNGLGISCFNIASHTFVNYPFYTYGLDEDREGLAISPHSGKIYSGHSSFMMYFNPDTTIVAQPADILFTSLNVFNKPYNTSISLLNNNPRFNFSFKQKSITVEFALPDYSSPYNNLYSWKLEGLEQEWNLSSANTTSYANLAPGSYTLRIKAANSKGIWSKEKSMVLVIRPPFYKQWWFITLCVLTLSGVGYYLFQLRINRIKERYRLRTKIATDLHDEIGSTLTSISILSNVSQQAFDKEPEKAKEMLQQIATQSKTVQQNMSDIVWAIRPDNEKLENLLVRMREYAAQTLEQLSIRTSIHIDELLIDKTLPLEHRKELLLIYKEAVNNIAKHSGATEVTVALHKHDHHLLLEIKDNGSWKSNGKTSGTGIGSMHQRAAAINGKAEIIHAGEGTLVKISIPVT